MRIFNAEKYNERWVGSFKLLQFWESYTSSCQIMSFMMQGTIEMSTIRWASGTRTVICTLAQVPHWALVPRAKASVCEGASSNSCTIFIFDCFDRRLGRALAQADLYHESHVLDLYVAFSTFSVAFPCCPLNSNRRYVYHEYAWIQSALTFCQSDIDREGSPSMPIDIWTSFETFSQLPCPVSLPQSTFQHCTQICEPTLRSSCNGSYIISPILHLPSWNPRNDMERINDPTTRVSWNSLSRTVKMLSHLVGDCHWPCMQPWFLKPSWACEGVRFSTRYVYRWRNDDSEDLGASTRSVVRRRSTSSWC